MENYVVFQKEWVSRVLPDVDDIEKGFWIHDRKYILNKDDNRRSYLQGKGEIKSILSSFPNSPKIVKIKNTLVLRIKNSRYVKLMEGIQVADIRIKSLNKIEIIEMYPTPDELYLRFKANNIDENKYVDLSILICSKLKGEGMEWFKLLKLLTTEDVKCTSVALIKYQIH